MKVKYLILLASLFSAGAMSATTVSEGVVKQADVITTEVGRDGKPLLGAAVGVGIGSTIGSGSGNDAAKVVGGIMGARRQAKKSKQTLYGWRYIVEVNNAMKVVDVWCPKPGATCDGITSGKQVYVVNDNELVVKQN